MVCLGTGEVIAAAFEDMNPAVKTVSNFKAGSLSYTETTVNQVGWWFHESSLSA
jgi:hypothetical protein